MQFVAESDIYTATIGRYSLAVGLDTLDLADDGVTIARLNLVPVLNGRQLRIRDMETRANILRFHCEDNDFTVNVEIGDTFVAYWLEGHFATIDSLTYFDKSTIGADVWQAFVSGGHDKPCSMGQNRRVPIGTSYIHGETLPGAWAMSPPPTACSFRVDGEVDEWLGFSCPLPISLETTCFEVDDGRFSIRFRHVYSVNDTFPKVYIIPELTNAYSVLSYHCYISRRLELVQEKKPYYDWWSKPTFCTWGQQFNSGMTQAEQFSACNSVLLREWVQILENNTGINDFNVIVDIGWYNNKGDYKVASDRFCHLREDIDWLKQRGHHILLWFSPFPVSVDSEYARTYAHAQVKNKDGCIATGCTYGDCEQGYYIRDYSVRDTQEMMKHCLRYLLSEDDGCLNADGLKVDFNYLLPAASKHSIANPRWGTGNLMYRKVMKLIYETAHIIKQDALISISGQEPYLQPYMNVLRLNDHFGTEIDEWCKRARIATHTLPEILFDCDGWLMSREKSLEYLVVAPVLGIPTVHHVVSFDDPTRLSPEDFETFVEVSGHPGDHDRCLQEEDWGRLAASWHVYSNSPVTPDAELIISPESNVFYRKYSCGPLKGFYSALAIDRRCLVTYSERQIMAMATKDMGVDIPIPPGYQVADISICVMENGKPRTSNVSSVDKKDQGVVHLDMNDAGRSGEWYRIALKRG